MLVVGSAIESQHQPSSRTSKGIGGCAGCITCTLLEINWGVWSAGAYMYESSPLLPQTSERINILNLSKSAQPVTVRSWQNPSCVLEHAISKLDRQGIPLLINMSTDTDKTRRAGQSRLRFTQTSTPSGVWKSRSVLGDLRSSVIMRRGGWEDKNHAIFVGCGAKVFEVRVPV